MIHHEADRTAAAAHQNDRINQADMIGNDQRRAFLGHLVDAMNSQAVHRFDEQPGNEAQQEFRHQGVDVNRHQSVQQGCQREQGRDGKTGAEQCRCAQCAGDHEQRVHDVVGGDDACPLLRRTAQLYQRVQRDDEETAEDTQQ